MHDAPAHERADRVAEPRPPRARRRRSPLTPAADDRVPAPRPGVVLEPAVAPGVASEPVAPAAVEVEPVWVVAPVLSLAVRRSGRRGNRVLAVMSLLAGLAVTAWVITTAMEPFAPTPIQSATAPAWAATSRLSGTLRTLEPSGSPTASRPLAAAAATAVSSATTEVESLRLAGADTPPRARVLRALRANAAWIDAVAATLADPRSPRRAELADLAGAAALGASLLTRELPEAAGSVGGTGRLLSATRPR